MAIWPFSLLEKKSLADPTDTDFAIFTRGSSGLEVQAVANAVRLISEGAATLDIDVIKRGTADKVAHPALPLLRGEANLWTSGYEFIRDLTAAACIYDAGGLAWVNRVNGKPIEAIGYEQGRITYQRASDGSGEPTYSINGKPVDASNIIHLRGPFSRSPVSLACNAIATAANRKINPAVARARISIFAMLAWMGCRMTQSRRYR